MVTSESPPNQSIELVTVTVEAPGYKTAEQQSVIGLCMPMCILRFIDAVIWTFIVIFQLFIGLGFWHIVWNVVATGVSYVYAVRLLGVCRSNEFNSAKIDNLAKENRNFSGICLLWYGAQVLFLDAGGILVLSLLVDITILIIAVITLSRLSKLRQQ